MKKLLIAMLLLSACGGKLTDEQRKKLHEGMSTQDIKRVSEADLQQAGEVYGSKVLAALGDVNQSLSGRRIDSLSKAYQVRIYALTPSGTQLKEIEKNLIDAYISSMAGGQAGNNLQKIGTDSLLYTKPVFKSHPDGAVEFTHAIGIMIPVKTVVLSMPQP